jgi:hypothetical protein
MAMPIRTDFRITRDYAIKRTKYSLDLTISQVIVEWEKLIENAIMKSHNSITIEWDQQKFSKNVLDILINKLKFNGMSVEVGPSDFQCISQQIKISWE